MQEGTPEYTSFIAKQAFARAKASDEVVYGNSPFKEKPPTREEILAKAQQSLLFIVTGKQIGRAHV